MLTFVCLVTTGVMLNNKHVSALCDSGAEICVANSSVVEGLNLNPIGQIQLPQYIG